MVAFGKLPVDPALLSIPNPLPPDQDARVTATNIARITSGGILRITD